MKIKESCKNRRIRTLDIFTPLLVPSFSSILSEDIDHVHKSLKDYISNISLISAYDIYHKYIDKDNLWFSEITFIDSGNFETEYLKNTNKLKDWSYDLYKQVLNDLPSLSRYVVINYDHIEPLKRQLDKAKDLFSSYDNYAKCFLCKPTNQSVGLVDISKLSEYIDKIYEFDILGFTEKELGNSLKGRCENIVRIRELLNRTGYNIPIQIFGCLDPLSILSYFMCGADIFDGLSWLRFSFYNKTAVYFNNHALLKGGWNNTDAVVRMFSSIENLNELSQLVSLMNLFIRNKNMDVFNLSQNCEKEIKTLIGVAGIDFEG